MKPFLPHSFLLAACLSIFAERSQAQCPAQTLVPSWQQPLQWFGASVELAGDVALVGAPLEQDGQNRRGTVYAFQRNAVTGLWGEVQRLVPSVTEYYMRFGALMDLQADTVAIAAPGDSSSPFHGGVFIYDRDPASGAWTESQFLTVPNANFFGSMVALEGPLLIVTEAWATSMFVGAVHIYRRDSVTGQFSHEQEIPSLSPTVNNRFAHDAALVEDRWLLLGDAQATVGTVASAGAIRIYERAPGSGQWSEMGQIQSPDPNVGGYFGATFEWDGRQLVVSETRDNTQAFFGGAAHVYEPDGSGGWVHVQRIQRPNTPFSTHFGGVVSLADGQLILRDLLRRTNAHRSILQRYLRDDLTGRWHPVGTYEDPVQYGHTDFGPAAVSGGHLLVGAPGSIIPGTPDGRAFIFSLGSCDTIGSVYCSPNGTGPSGAPVALRAYGTLDASEDFILMRTTGLPPLAPAMLLTSRTAAVSTLPGAVGNVCLGAPIGRFAALLSTSSGEGTVAVELDLGAFPGASGPVAAMAGEMWHFQSWYRAPGAPPTTGLSDAVQLVLY